MPAVIAAFLCPLFHAVSNIIDAHLSNNVFRKLPTLIFYNCLTNFFAASMVLVFGLPQWYGWEIMPLLALVGMIDVFYQIPYYEALRRGDTSVVVAWFSLGYVLVPVLAYLMVDEKLSFVQYAGFGIIIAASVVLNIENPRKIKINKAFYLMLLSSLLLSLQAVLYKYALEKTDWISAVFYSALFSTLTVFGFLMPRIVRLNIKANFPRYKTKFYVFGLNEFVNQVGTVASIFAMSLLPVVAVESINSTQPLFVLGIGAALYALFGNRFKEDVSTVHLLRKSICFVFITAGVFMVLK